ncbi:uncharacterized protein PG986_011227 [Apiospora aurea]|uniref:Uncharacterized protein n=1 Tax=Apiospora aurea TaxID=335848 RepID=A0ABR1Q4H7_9PEZI
MAGSIVAVAALFIAPGAVAVSVSVGSMLLLSICFLSAVGVGVVIVVDIDDDVEVEVVDVVLSGVVINVLAVDVVVFSSGVDDVFNVDVVVVFSSGVDIALDDDLVFRVDTVVVFINAFDVIIGVDTGLDDVFSVAFGVDVNVLVVVRVTGSGHPIRLNTLVSNAASTVARHGPGVNVGDAVTAHTPVVALSTLDQRGSLGHRCVSAARLQGDVDT